MTYMMKQKFLSMGDDFTIKNEAGEEVYFVDGKAFAVGDKLSFQDAEGRELAYISEKLLSLHNTYQIYRNDELFAEVKKNWTFFRDNYTIDVPGPNDYSVSGDFFDHEYEFERMGRTVARVSKALFSWSDTYGIDIEPGEDDIVILATVVVIDLINGDKQH